MCDVLLPPGVNRMCDVLLPPGVNPTAVKYIYHIISYHIKNNIEANNVRGKVIRFQKGKEVPQLV
jgi:hypothetical protein